MGETDVTTDVSDVPFAVPLVVLNELR